MTRNFAYDPQFALRQFPRLYRVYGLYTYLLPKSAQATLIGSDPCVPVLPNEFLIPPVQHLDSFLRRLVTTTEEATVVIPQWNTSWYATAIRASFIAMMTDRNLRSRYAECARERGCGRKCRTDSGQQ